MNNAVIAANRFGLGARPDELSQLKSDPRGWLTAQLTSQPVPTAVTALAPATQVFEDQVEALKERKEAKQESAKAGQAKPADVAGRRKTALEHYQAQVLARYQIAVQSNQSFRERLVHFWTNHFAVSMDKNIVSALAGTMENEAIRPNLDKHFYDLLVAAEQHPAMILYLDNQASTGPDSQLAQLLKRRANAERKIDINENLGREILELHTLGVDGGYRQTDVTRFATVLTGWSIAGDGQLARFDKLDAATVGGKRVTPGQFVFRPALHQPGTQTVLGKRYGQSGIAQPLAVLKDLASHPSTAQFIATKLVRHVVADEPPATAVATVAKAFRDSDGHLPTVHAALVNCGEAWQAENRKLKTPHEFAISTWRALGDLPNRPAQIASAFELIGQRPYTPGSPAGWADIAGRWDGPDALMKRIEWVTQYVSRSNSRTAPLEQAQASLGDSLGEHTRMAITAAMDATQARVLWLMSPEFLRR